MKRRIAWTLFWALGLGCAPVDTLDETSTSAAAVAGSSIFGGVVNTGDPEVFMMIMQYPNGAQGACSATLIAPSTLLTAAHCVDPRIENQASVRIWVHNKTSVQATVPNDFTEIVETRIHPGWSATNQNLGNDIALARLETPLSVAPKPWNAININAFGGKPLRVVGYGLANTRPQTSGVKRVVDLEFAQVTPTLIFLGNQNGKGVCSGDSGGPSFHTFEDGVERVVGVHSFTASGDCDFGADSRVDIYASFINQWLAEKESPTCALDGRCKSGCTPVDQDCVCGSDGTCSAQCLNLAQDPDCPKDCVANGVCSLAACPRPDADCLELGETCQNDVQCPSRLCASDLQTPGRYCSRFCAGDADCPAGMDCASDSRLCQFPQKPVRLPGETCTAELDFCSDSTVCTGRSGDAPRCQVPCSKPGDCPLKTDCQMGVGGVKFCYAPPPPPVELDSSRALFPAASSCTTTGGWPEGAGLLVCLGWLGLGRRPRNRE